MKKTLYFLVFIVLVACGKKDGSSGESFSSYSLVKVDSFQVNNMTRVQITDFSESENIYLAYTEAENDILEISPDGEILKRVNRTGDGPNNMGNWVPIGLSFGPSGERVFQLPFQLLTYDKDYSQTSNIRIQSPLAVRAYIP